ncbi:MAG: hypothetical protein MI747_00395 [Desulfobacterales bacterium]|nr:hypothetical protein [Desulfobacterales bacterium]
MFGFKKKKKEKEPPASAPNEDGTAETGEDAKKKEKPKKSLVKKLVLFVLLPAILLAGGGVGYFYFAKGDGDAPIYVPIVLEHVKLPEEMLKFTFDQMPEVYDALLIFNAEVDLLEREIQRIREIGERYPQQRKIAAKERKFWEKNQRTLIKAFSKLEKPIKESYVLFLVNTDQGLAGVQEKRAELAGTADAALKIAQDQTRIIKGRKPEAPPGLIKGTLYTLKKKFL